jgi:O-antigen ligase
MNRVYSSAMIIILALVLCTAVLALGAVTPDLAFISFSLAASMGVLWAGKLLTSGECFWKKSPMNLPVGLFALYALVRYSFSKFEYEARVELFQIGACTLVYFVAANSFHHRSDRTILVWTLMGLAVFESSYGLWQFATNSDAVFVWTRPASYKGRASGTYICPNHLAGFLEMALAMILARVTVVRRETNSLQQSAIVKIFMAYVALMAALGILFSFSRAGWITTFAGMVLLAAWAASGPKANWMRYTGLALALALLVGIISTLDPVQNYVFRTLRQAKPDPGMNLRDSTIGGRTLMWGGALKIFRENPVLGTGGGSWQWEYQKYRHQFVLNHSEYAHNDILNLASDYGAIGFVLIAMMFSGFYRQARWFTRAEHPSETRAFALGAIVAVTILLIHSWFDFNMHIPANALLMATILGFTAAVPDREERFVRVRLSNPVKYLIALGTLVAIGAGGWAFAKVARASLLTDLGESAKKYLDYPVAIDHLNRATALDPRFPLPWIRLGDVYRSQARWRLGPEKQQERIALAQEAIAAYTRALALNPRRTEAILGLGGAFELANEPEKALRQYILATETDPSNSLTHFTLGRFYKERGEMKLAEASLRKAHTIVNESSIVLNLLEIDEERARQQTNDPATLPK